VLAVSPTYDYGFVSQSDVVNVATKNEAGDEVPASAIVLALGNFRKELKNIFNTYGSKPAAEMNPIVKAKKQADYDSREKLKLLKLSNDG
jgi:hypothetical protein